MPPTAAPVLVDLKNNAFLGQCRLRRLRSRTRALTRIILRWLLIEPFLNPLGGDFRYLAILRRMPREDSKEPPLCRTSAIRNYIRYPRVSTPLQISYRTDQTGA